MRTALIIGNGQIGSEIAAQLGGSGVAVRIATRSGGGSANNPAHVKADASDRTQLAEAADRKSVV